MQLPVPVQAPLQPAKVLPTEAWATSVTTALLEMMGHERVQLGSQVTPGGVMVTLPVPLPALFRVNGRVVVVVPKLAVTLRALTRRAKPVAESESESRLLSFQDMTLDTQHREVTRGGQHISLTRTEFALLQVFMEHPRRVMERNTLLNEVWGFEFPTTANSLEVYIGYLRRKTETGGRSRLIHTVRGIGYVLRETPP